MTSQRFTAYYAYRDPENKKKENKNSGPSMAEVNTLNSEIKIAVIGGDERQLITAHELSDVGLKLPCTALALYI